MTRKPTTPLDGPIQLPASITDYLESIHLRGRRRTAQSTGNILGRLHRWLSSVHHVSDPATATAAQLQAYQSHLVSDYRSHVGLALERSTIATHIATIRGWYRWLMATGKIIANPSQSLEVKWKRSRIVVQQPLSLQEATALVQTQAGIVDLARAGSSTHAHALRNLAAICLGLATGRRVGGMTTLKVTDLDVTHRELRIEREKGMSGRVVPVAGWAVAVIQIYLRDARPHLIRNDAPWLFLDRHGTGPLSDQGFQDLLRKAIIATIKANPDLAELPSKNPTWHSLRVSFATLLFSNGCDIRSVNELMLHRCLSTTALYTPIPVDDLRRVFRTAHPRP